MEFLIPIPVGFVLALLWASVYSRHQRRKAEPISAEAYRRALAALAPRTPGQPPRGRATR